MFKVFCLLLCLLSTEGLWAQKQNEIIQKELREYLKESGRLNDKDSALLIVSRIDEISQPLLWDAQWIKVTKKGFLIQKNTFLVYFQQKKCRFIDEVDIEKSIEHLEALPEYSTLSPSEQQAVNKVLKVSLAYKLNQMRSEQLLGYMEQEIKRSKQDTVVIRLSTLDFDWEKAVIVLGENWKERAEELLGLKLRSKWSGNENSRYIVFASAQKVVEVISIPQWRITQDFHKVVERVLIPLQSNLLLPKGQKEFLLN
jgi:hypothetical protein